MPQLLFAAQHEYEFTVIPCPSLNSDMSRLVAQQITPFPNSANSEQDAI